MQAGDPTEGWFRSYLNEKGELAYVFPSRLHTSLEVFDWLFTDKPEEGFDVERLQSGLLSISGYSQSNGSHKEQVSQNYLVKSYKDGFLFLYCLNDLSWSHYAVPKPLQKYAPNISRSIFDIHTGERFDVHMLSNGMVLTVLAQYATSCVTLHNAVLWHPIQPGFPPSRRIYAVEVVKMSSCYRCQQSPKKCKCSQNQQRVVLSSSQATQNKTNETKLIRSDVKQLTNNPCHDENGAKNDNESQSSSVTDFNHQSEKSSTRRHFVVDPSTIKTLFGPWKGTKRVIAYNPSTGKVEKEQTSFFRLKLDWAAAVDIRRVQSKVVMGLFHDLFNPIPDYSLRFAEKLKNEQEDNDTALGTFGKPHLKDHLKYLAQNAV